MITEWTTPFIEAKDEFIEWLEDDNDFVSYESMLIRAVEIIARDGDFEYGERPDPRRVHVIDDGDYQGTLLFIIGADDYQPYNYYSTAVGYGSCSGCDALAGAYGNSALQYNLTLQMVQRIKKMGD